MVQLLRATRVLSAERRGSSLPVVVETEGGRRFTKLRGAAQGTAALVAEVVVGALADALGLRVPARSLVFLDHGVPSDDRDAELADLLRASRGYNLGFELLEGARELRPEHHHRVDEDEASAIVWLDALVMNPDRSPHNPNLLIRRGELWLVDHGAALGFQYDWRLVSEDSPRWPLVLPAHHVLRDRATRLADLDGPLAGLLTRDVVDAAVQSIPDDFLLPLLPPGAPARAVERRRAAYGAFLWKRLKPPRPFAVGALARRAG